jgi:hypothetical protein
MNTKKYVPMIVVALVVAAAVVWASNNVDAVENVLND